MNHMPTWDQFTRPVLQVLSDGEVRRLRELRDLTGREVQLTEGQLAEPLPSGQSKSGNRIGWAASYLTRVGALDRPARGQYVITGLGRQLLAEHPDGITEHDLRQLAREGDEWWIAGGSTSAKSVKEGPVAEADLDPVEQIETGIERIHADVASDLLTRLHHNQPAFFEQAVLDLLIAMGYGGVEGKATRTQLASDGGIDGIVDQDALGLSRIYVQAKRYALDSSIGRPEIQAQTSSSSGALSVEV